MGSSSVRSWSTLFPLDPTLSLLLGPFGLSPAPLPKGGPRRTPSEVNLTPSTCPHTVRGLSCAVTPPRVGLPLPCDPRCGWAQSGPDIPTVLTRPHSDSVDDETYGTTLPPSGTPPCVVRVSWFCYPSPTRTPGTGQGDGVVSQDVHPEGRRSGHGARVRESTSSESRDCIPQGVTLLSVEGVSNSCVGFTVVRVGTCLGLVCNFL